MKFRSIEAVRRILLKQGGAFSLQWAIGWRSTLKCWIVWIITSNNHSTAGYSHAFWCLKLRNIWMSIWSLVGQEKRHSLTPLPHPKRVSRTILYRGWVALTCISEDGITVLATWFCAITIAMIKSNFIRAQASWKRCCHLQL